MIMARVELKNITKVYNDNFKAVDKVNIDIADEEFLILLGPSGCGKSTILRMVAGLEDITDGQLLINETPMNDVRPKERGIAMVFQNYALYPHMTVAQNLSFGLELNKVPKKEIKERMTDVAKILKIESLLHKKPKHLSGGQRQRVALGRAIIRKPNVFLFDEPLSNLDAKLRVHMRAEIIDLHRRLKSTAIYVTHDQVEAMTLGDKIVLMKDGVVQQQGPPLELYNHPKNTFVASFIGSPSMNLFEVQVSKDPDGPSKSGLTILSNPNFNVLLEVDQQPNLENYAGKMIIIGIRPEHIMITEKANAENSISGDIQMIENMGDESYVFFSNPSQESEHMVAKIAADVSHKVGDKLYACINPDKIHLFDSLTTEVLL